MSAATMNGFAYGNAPVEPYRLKLFVCGMSARSERAISQARSICDEHLGGRYALEVVDITLDPAEAGRGQIVATPMLVKERPLPLRRLVGDLSRRDRVLEGLGLGTPS